MNRSYTWLAILGALVIVAAIVLSLFGYVAHSVQPNEIAVRLRSSRIISIEGPGIYHDLNLFADIVDVKIEGVPFCAEDPEVLTRDQQRIGLRVCGTVHRPGLEKADQYVQFWSQYRTFYLSDAALVGEEVRDVGFRNGLMQELGPQAMKVCVGDKTFTESVVGSARDVLRNCIDEEMSKLATNYGGLSIQNVIVPNIILGEEVQVLLDAITKAKFETDLAIQAAVKAKADADRTLAEEQGKIRVEQGKIQEEQRQKALTAELERKALEAQMQVIVAEKANELRAIQLSQEIAEGELQLKITLAKADLAKVAAEAQILTDNPAYWELRIAQMWADAWKNATKIVVPAGTDPMTVIDPDGQTPVVIPPPDGQD